eukprot:TRINITY_DN6634_c0_g1_i1.p1 TRINITY_DN6634_c0_g1~~TRINITY_DN6634_c0_g1_i1.p1  ORF type:complete len:238 (+),score=60.63 TRINITY_DN6634_c0_g1_i1:75-788(+)
MSFDPVERAMPARGNFVRPTGRGSKPCVKACGGPQDSGDIIGHTGTQQPSPQRAAHARARPDPAATRTAMQREEEAGEQPLRVGRKPHAAPEPSQSRERLYGAQGLPSVENSERFEHTQRYRTHGDIVGHRDRGEVPSEPVRVGRARVEEAPGAGANILTGATGTPARDPPPAGGKQRVGGYQGGPAPAPFATHDSPPSSSSRPRARHENHYEHKEGLLTGGSMQSTQRKDRTPLWY